jgi:formylglycine-generating enzyme required for sulfatase activity
MRLLLPILVVALLVTPAAYAEKRVALVIGNAAYKNAPMLQNPRNDATDVAAALKRLGFETIVGLDLDDAGMKEKSITFARAARDADVGLFYYSGHAMQFGGVNYLVPVEAVLRDEADVRRLTRVDDTVADLKQVKNVGILVLDACRDNPLAEELNRSMQVSRGLTVDHGLARIIAARGMIVSYATQAGLTAADGSGRNSPYTTAFLKNIDASEEIGAVFRSITSDVYNATGSKQLPELSLSLIGNFYLKDRPEPRINEPTPVPSEAERAWAATQGTTSQAVLEDYVKHYGDSFYGTLARARLAELKKLETASGLCGNDAPVTVSLSSRSPQPLSAEEECTLKPKDVFKECDRCPDMVIIPAGTFTMGSPSDEKERYEDEGPQHKAIMSHPFGVSKFSVTVDQFSNFVKETGYDAASTCHTFQGERGEPSAEGPDRGSFRNPGFSQDGSHPVVCLNWSDARAYVDWLSKTTGKPYRLLTETEWEYAARAGTSTRYFFGDNESDMCRYGNGVDETTKTKILGNNWTPINCKDGYTYTAPVGSFLPNVFGLYDMHGNAWSWVEDCYHYDYAGAPSDGSAWISGDCGRRVLRGGSWNNVARDFRAAVRNASPASARFPSYGLRIARTLSP